MQRSSIIVFVMLVCLPLAADTQAFARKAAPMKYNSSESYSLPTVVLYGDDSTEDHHISLKRIRVIMQSDMELLWQELGISTNDWSPLDPFGIQERNQPGFPMLYAAQGFIAFEREYTSEELDQLIVECHRADKLVHTEAARRTARMILDAAELQRKHHGRLLFRAGMCDPSQTEAREHCPK
jgi:hypothetical protein